MSQILKHPKASPLRERTVAVMAADYAHSIGLNAVQADSCAEFAAFLVRSKAFPTIFQAIARAKDKAMALKRAGETTC